MTATSEKNLGEHRVLETFWKATWTKTPCAKPWENTRFLKRFGKQHGRNFKTTCAETLENTRFLKHFVRQHGRKQHEQKHGTNTRFLKRFGKQHGRNVKITCAKNWEKNQVIQTFWKATWTQHKNNMRKNLRKHQVIETFWESNMDATSKQQAQKNGENTRFLKRFGKATWTQHGSNRCKNLGKHQVLEAFWKATWTQH